MRSVASPTSMYRRFSVQQRHQARRQQHAAGLRFQPGGCVSS
jgi:hypothetical protein